jgi:hypothetical protein
MKSDPGPTFRQYPPIRPDRLGKLRLELTSDQVKVQRESPRAQFSMVIRRSVAAGSNQCPPELSAAESILASFSAVPRTYHTEDRLGF